MGGLGTDEQLPMVFRCTNALEQSPLDFNIRILLFLFLLCLDMLAWKTPGINRKAAEDGLSRCFLTWFTYIGCHEYDLRPFPMGFSPHDL